MWPVFGCMFASKAAFVEVYEIILISTAQNFQNLVTVCISSQHVDESSRNVHHHFAKVEHIGPGRREGVDESCLRIEQAGKLSLSWISWIVAEKEKSVQKDFQRTSQLQRSCTVSRLEHFSFWSWGFGPWLPSCVPAYFSRSYSLPAAGQSRSCTRSRRASRRPDELQGPALQPRSTHIFQDVRSRFQEKYIFLF